METLVSSRPALNYAWGRRFAMFDDLECVKLPNEFGVLTFFRIFAMMASRMPRELYLM